MIYEQGIASLIQYFYLQCGTGTACISLLSYNTSFFKMVKY